MILAVVITLASATLIFLGPIYILWLYQDERLHPQPATDISKLPFVDVIVPMKDEAAWIATKIENLKSLVYPVDRLKIWLVDGGSVDGTLQFIKAAIDGEPHFELIEFGEGNKIAQINTTLPNYSSEWVLVTDCDAWLPPQTLSQMIAMGEADERLGVIGVTVYPHQAHYLESLYWRMLNWLLQRESCRGFASQVSGPCYLFRGCLFNQFPKDVIADDIFVTLMAARRGYSVKIIDAQVVEFRAPVNIRQLFIHKIRKACAYLREIFRFMPDIFRMSPAGRRAYLFRTGQLLVIPSLSAMVLVISLAWLKTTILPSLTWSVWIILIGILSASLVFLIWKFAPTLIHYCTLALLLIVVLITSLLIYPFFTQSASYPKVGKKRPFEISTP